MSSIPLMLEYVSGLGARPGEIVRKQGLQPLIPVLVFPRVPEAVQPFAVFFPQIVMKCTICR